MNQGVELFLGSALLATPNARQIALPLFSFLFSHLLWLLSKKAYLIHFLEYVLMLIMKTYLGLEMGGCRKIGVCNVQCIDISLF